MTLKLDRGDVKKKKKEKIKDEKEQKENCKKMNIYRKK